MIEIVRNELLKSKIISEFVSQGEIKQAIFHEFKPKKDIQEYIILKDKPLEIGHIEKYQLDVLIFGRDLQQMLNVEKEVREILNDKHGTRVVSFNNKHIKDLTMLTGGGRQYDETKDRYVSVQYFRITI